MTSRSAAGEAVLRRFGPPPSPHFDVQPHPDQVEFYRENGFLAVERLTTDEELDWLAAIYQACFDPADELASRTRWDTEVDDAGATIVSRAQAFFPEAAVPQLLDTACRRNGKRFASALIGVADEALTSWSHMIDKPANIGRPTYWHQDEAYWDPMLSHQAIGVWMPLSDCTIDMGCMQFIPGSHRHDVLPHHSRRPEIRADLYEVLDDVDASAAVACPLPAGGATFHHSRTLHFTAANVSQRTRRAYATEFETEPVLRAAPLDKPWTRTANGAADPGSPRTYMADGVLREIPSGVV